MIKSRRKFNLCTFKVSKHSQLTNPLNCWASDSLCHLPVQLTVTGLATSVFCHSYSSHGAASTMKALLHCHYHVNESCLLNLQGYPTKLKGEILGNSSYMNNIIPMPVFQTGCLIALARISTSTLNKSDGHTHLCLVSNCRRKLSALPHSIWC